MLVLNQLRSIARLRNLLGSRSQRDEHTDVVVYEGLITLEPADDYGEGTVRVGPLAAQRRLEQLIYEHLQVPDEDGILPVVHLQGRIIVEMHDDPDLSWLLP